MNRLIVSLVFLYTALDVSAQPAVATATEDSLFLFFERFPSLRSAEERREGDSPRRIAACSGFRGDGEYG